MYRYTLILIKILFLSIVRADWLDQVLFRLTLVTSAWHLAAGRDVDYNDLPIVNRICSKDFVSTCTPTGAIGDVC